MFNWESPSNYGLGILILIVWEAFWKAMGLWRAAKDGEKLWFTGILLVNFLGVVPIVYLWRTKKLQGTIDDTLRFLRIKKQ
jgi:hypothetical protein